jgi:parallel beta-helix repeat protein
MLGYGKDASGRWVSPHFAWGVYLDDNTGGVDVFGNILARCSRAGMHLHNGRDNHIENNIFIENGQQQYEYSGWTSSQHYWKEHLPTMIRGYESVASEPAWKNMRNMQLHPTNAVLADGKIMTGNEFVRNIIYYRNPQAKLVRFGTVPYDHNLTDSNLVFHFDQELRTGQKSPGKETNSEWVAWQALGNDQHSLIADPLLVNPAQDDFRLKSESPAFKLGFKPIPIEEIGPYSDPLRASWPIVEAEGAREKPLMAAGKP